MSTSPSASASRSWKGAAPAPPGADLPRWRREEPRPRQQRSRRGRFWLGLLFLAVLCGLITWLILWLRPSKGTAVLILTAGYEENLAVPHNVAGRDGAKALAEMVSGMETSGAVEGGRLHLPKPPRLLTDVKEWAAGLDTAREKTVLLFVALHGGADKDGAYLLPQDALSPGAVEQGDPRLRLTTILDRLAQLPRDRNIVLVLDATQAPANWRAGMLHNSFVRALDALEDRIAAMPNLVVLCASDAEQRSWVCDELRRTAFTHFLIEGLKGHADGAVDSVKDG
ncbi:MAG TPA: hypothetical protein VEL76_29300, partial [Gemmataceae bacterium]|nr:hypothetical protein [Gemmataceae bacterium]